MINSWNDIASVPRNGEDFIAYLIDELGNNGIVVCWYDKESEVFYPVLSGIPLNESLMKLWAEINLPDKRIIARSCLMPSKSKKNQKHIEPLRK